MTLVRPGWLPGPAAHSPALGVLVFMDARDPHVLCQLPGASFVGFACGKNGEELSFQWHSPEAFLYTFLKK